jgi:hypothetical protein
VTDLTYPTHPTYPTYQSYLILLLTALCAMAVSTAAGAQAPPDDRRLQLTVGVETLRDRFTYHFDNPSSFDTAELVPHFFEQRYIADNLWAVVTFDYVAGLRWQTSIGATPERTAIADDYDTFFNPQGVVWVSGTTGDASIHSLRFVQRVDIAHAGIVRIFGGYRLRLDRADFGLGHKTVTRNGVLAEAFDVTTPELTRSQMHEVLVGAGASKALNDRWALKLEGEFAPSALARLSVRLPAKYPGQDLVFLGKLMAGTAHVALIRRHDRWPIEMAIDAGQTWSYRASERLARQTLGARVAIARAW